MFCQKCGNELKKNEMNDNEMVCVKCGYDNNSNLENDIKSNNNAIKWFVGICITIIIIVGIIAIQSGKNRKINGNSNMKSTVQSQKQYYHFIDKEYGTFDFTEEEFIKIFMKNIGGTSNYVQQGYERVKATIPNQYNYVKIINAQIYMLTVVSNPSNGKVVSIKIYVTGRFSEKESKEYAINMTANIVSGIIKCDLHNMSEEEKKSGKKLCNELLDGISIEKGLDLTYLHEQIGQEGMVGTSIEIKVVK